MLLALGTAPAGSSGWSSPSRSRSGLWALCGGTLGGALVA